MGFHSQIINMVVVDSVLVSAKRLKRNTFAGRNKINEYGIIKLIIVHAQRDVTIHLAGILHRRTDARLCASKDVCPPGHKHNHITVSAMTKEYTIKGMNCSHCQATVAKSISSVKGVKQVDVNLSTGIATVEGSSSVTSQSMVPSG